MKQQFTQQPGELIKIFKRKFLRNLKKIIATKISRIAKFNLIHFYNSKDIYTNTESATWGQNEKEFLIGLKSLEKNDIYILRTGTNGGAGHFQLVYFEDGKWCVYSTKTNQYAVTNKTGDLTKTPDELFYKQKALPRESLEHYGLNERTFSRILDDAWYRLSDGEKDPYEIEAVKKTPENPDGPEWCSCDPLQIGVYMVQWIILFKLQK